MYQIRNSMKIIQIFESDSGVLVDTRTQHGIDGITIIRKGYENYTTLGVRHQLCKELKEGDVTLIKSAEKNRGRWKMGIV